MPDLMVGSIGRPFVGLALSSPPNVSSFGGAAPLYRAGKLGAGLFAASRFWRCSSSSRACALSFLLPLLPKSPDLVRRSSKPKLDLRAWFSCWFAELLSGICGMFSGDVEVATPPLGVRGLLELTMVDYLKRAGGVRRRLIVLDQGSRVSESGNLSWKRVSVEKSRWIGVVELIASTGLLQ